MAERFVPERAFPEEVVEDLRAGVPEPIIYSGPLYRGNGAETILKEAAAHIEATKANAPRTNSERIARIGMTLGARRFSIQRHPSGTLQPDSTSTELPRTA